MTNPIRSAKSALRAQVRARLKEIAATERAAASAQARSLLVRQRYWQEAKKILFYAPLPEELDMWPLVAEALGEGKTVALPRFGMAQGGYVACEVKDPAKELQVGRFDIREPLERCSEIPVNRLDFILVPGIAFDLQGRRLGRGKGYYDRLLAGAQGRACGVAFDCQIVSELPVEPQDVRVNCILTPTRWLLV